MSIYKFAALAVAGLLAAGLSNAAVSGTGSSGQANDLRLVPFPKRIAINQGRFSVSPTMTITVTDSLVTRQAAQDLKDELSTAANVVCVVKSVPAAGKECPMDAGAFHRRRQARGARHNPPTE